MGSGQCVYWAPGVFTQGDRALSVVVDPRGGREERIVIAVVRCPVEAISLEIDGARIGPGQLQDWCRGSVAEVPLELQAHLGEGHDALRSSLAADRLADLLHGLSAHHALEEGSAYPEIGALVGSALVDAFDRDRDRDRDRDHARLAGAGRVLDRRVPEGSAGDVADQVAALAMALDEHIRLEEAILFPAALPALAPAAGRAVRSA